MKYLYARHSYGWGAEQLSYYISFMGGSRAMFLLFVLPSKLYHSYSCFFMLNSYAIMQRLSLSSSPSLCLPAFRKETANYQF